MKNKSQTKPDDPEQSKRFIETAKKLGCDENEDRFNDTLKQVAKHSKKKEDEPQKD